MKKRRIVIIGCGNMAREHARDIQAFAGFELVAASDPVELARAEMQKVAPLARLYADTNELLSKEKPELALVATAASAHAELSIAALRAGAHVLCEKPLTVTLAEADRVLATARETGRMMLVDHQFRINPRSQAALRAVREGAIGEIRSMLCAAKGRFGGWELVESGTHLFDLALLFGGVPQWVTGHLLVGNRLATAEDIVESTAVGTLSTGKLLGERVFASVGFDNGAVLKAEFFDTPSTNFLQVAGTKGLLHVPIGAAPAKPWIYPKAFVNPNDASGWREVPVKWADWGQRHNIYAYDLWEQWLREDRAMAVAGKHPMDAEFGRQALEIIHGTFESHFQQGARVMLPLAQRDHPLARRAGKKA